jgi:hypothetical protein
MSKHTQRINKLNDAMDAMRRPDSRMIQTNYQGRPDFWIAPSGGRVEPDIAKKIIAHPQVIGGRDALFRDTIKRGGCVRVTTGGQRLSLTSPTNPARHPAQRFEPQNPCPMLKLILGGKAQQRAWLCAGAVLFNQLRIIVQRGARDERQG